MLSKFISEQFLYKENLILHIGSYKWNRLSVKKTPKLFNFGPTRVWRNFWFHLVEFRHVFFFRKTQPPRRWTTLSTASETVSFWPSVAADGSVVIFVTVFALFSLTTWVRIPLIVWPFISWRPAWAEFSQQTVYRPPLALIEERVGPGWAQKIHDTQEKLE